MDDKRTLSGNPTLLIILDGFGLNPADEYNAVKIAKTPNFDRYFETYPTTALEASGRGVGLPEGQMGNSEVGHMTLGSGMIVKQDLVRIDDAIEDGSFYLNPALLDAVNAARANNRPLHLVGLVSDGGVHSHNDHLVALIKLCAQNDVIPHLHMITDGRDTAPQVALEYLPELDKTLSAANGCIATVIGRYYAMDRDKRWDRVFLAWDAMVNGEGLQAADARSALESQYAQGTQDEFIKPAVIGSVEPMKPADNIVLFNFRNDRVRQLAAAFSLPDFDSFDRGESFAPFSITCMTHYGSQFDSPVVFSPQRPQTTLAKVVSEAGLKQLHCAETEKYPHVTFFFNGGKEKEYAGEKHSLIRSPDVRTYDLKPEMSAKEVAETMRNAITSEEFSFLVVNFANGDMVGHTAVQKAIIEAVEVMDLEVGGLLDLAVELGYSVILTADHGNCDEMVDPVTGQPHTQHSQHPVPCMVIDPRVKALRSGDNLSAVAPTVLSLMGLKQPELMTGNSLIIDE